MSDSSARTSEFQSDAHPQASAFIRELLERSPTLLKGQIALLIDRRGAAFWREADRLLDLSFDSPPRRSLAILMK